MLGKLEIAQFRSNTLGKKPYGKVPNIIFFTYKEFLDNVPA